jgi:hypothetical protein
MLKYEKRLLDSESLQYGGAVRLLENCGLIYYQSILQNLNKNKGETWKKTGNETNVSNSISVNIPY